MISVAMTTYNGEKYIEQQINSILNQTVLPDELVIVDDCSSDNTFEIVRKLVETSEKKINIIVRRNDNNLGYVRNFYEAISMASGDFIFLADQDDVWHVDKVERMLNVLEVEKCEAVCTNFNLIDEKGLSRDKSDYNVRSIAIKKKSHIIPISFKRLVFGNVAQGCTFCFTKNVRDAYLKVENFEVIHDYQIMFTASLLGKVVFLNEELLDYRIHSNNAIGFSEKKASKGIKVKKPTKKPMMVCFFNDLDKVVKIEFKWFWALLYYFRIPYFGFKLMQKVRH